jgi:hypothetical protein
MKTIQILHAALMTVVLSAIGLGAHGDFKAADAAAPAPAPQAPAQAPQSPPPAAEAAPAAALAPAPAGAADIMNDPEIKKQLEGKTPQEAQTWGATMAAKGLKRLPYDDLVTWNDVRTKLAAASPAVCAGFWKGGTDPAQFQKALASLSKEDMDRWTMLQLKALSLEAKNAPFQPSQPEDIPQLTKLVMAELKEDDRAKFQTLAAKGANISDDEACWLMTAMLQHATSNAGDQATKDRSLRAFAALGSPK